MDLYIANRTRKRKREQEDPMMEEDKENDILMAQVARKCLPGSRTRINASYIPRKNTCKLLARRVRKSFGTSKRNSCKLLKEEKQSNDIFVLDENSNLGAKAEPTDDITTQFMLNPVHMDLTEADMKSEPESCDTKADLMGDGAMMPQDLVTVDFTEAEIKSESEELDSCCSEVLSETHESEERFAVRFKNFPFGIEEERIKLLIYLATDPEEVVFLSISKNLSRKVHGHGFIIVNTERALQKLLGLNGIKMKGKPINLYQVRLKDFDNGKKKNERKRKSIPVEIMQEPEIRFMGYKFCTKEEIYSDIDPRQLFMDR